MTPDQVMQALADGLAAALPGRLVTRCFKPMAQRTDDELLTGIVSLICRGEKDYANYPGREAQLGTLQVVMLGQLKVAEDADSLAVEKSELGLAEEIKAFLQGEMPMGVRSALSDGFAQSGQLESPFGWVAFELTVVGD